MTNLQRTARFFRQHRRRYISAFVLMRIAGMLGWRTRLSDLRKPPYSMNVEWNGNPRNSRYRYQGKVA